MRRSAFTLIELPVAPQQRLRPPSGPALVSHQRGQARRRRYLHRGVLTEWNSLGSRKLLSHGSEGKTSLNLWDECCAMGLLAQARVESECVGIRKVIDEAEHGSCKVVRS
jgi:hypothetical protein